MIQEPNSLPVLTKETMGAFLASNAILRRTLRFSGEVNPTSIQSILKEILRLYEADPHEAIVLFLTTPGGSSAQAFSFHDTIRLYRNLRLIIIASGHCNSAGITMLFAVKKEFRFSTRHTQFLFHPARNSFNNAIFTNEDHAIEAQGLAMFDRMYEDVIKNESSISQKNLKKLINNELRTSVEEMLDLELIKDIIE